MKVGSGGEALGWRGRLVSRESPAHSSPARPCSVSGGATPGPEGRSVPVPSAHSCHPQGGQGGRRGKQAPTAQRWVLESPSFHRSARPPRRHAASDRSPEPLPLCGTTFPIKGRTRATKWMGRQGSKVEGQADALAGRRVRATTGCVLSVPLPPTP